MIVMLLLRRHDFEAAIACSAVYSGLREIRIHPTDHRVQLATAAVSLDGCTRDLLTKMGLLKHKGKKVKELGKKVRQTQRICDT